MRKVTKRSYLLFALVAAFFVMLGVLGVKYATYGASWATKSINTHIFSYGNLVKAGSIYDCNGKELVSTKDGKRQYSSDFYTRVSTLHITGDKAGIISTGVQSLYRSSLVGYNPLTGVDNAIKGTQKGITLTVDSDACVTAYKALNGAKGAVMVYNYKTGETKVMVSAPSYDPENPPSSGILNTDPKYEGVYINRCLSGLFTPGSTMKVITAVSALENIDNIKNKKWKCTGSIQFGSDSVICSGTHGDESFQKALNRSCNVAFADIAVTLGAKKLKSTAKELGLFSRQSVGKMSGSKSYLDLSDTSKSELGWAGVGQYTTLVTPVHMLQIMGTIANNGTCISPTIIKSASNDYEQTGTINETVSLSPEIASEMDTLLRSNVKDYYGDSNFPNLQMCGKTGSAERGKTAFGGKYRHCWFVGYSQKEDFPYAVVVIMENLTSGSGYSNAVPVANKVLQSLYKNK